MLKAEAEAWRMMNEWSRLASEVQREGDQYEIQPLMNHAHILIDYVTMAPVTSAAMAGASMRFLLGEERGIKGALADQFHFSGFANVLAWIEALVAEEKRKGRS